MKTKILALSATLLQQFLNLNIPNSTGTKAQLELTIDIRIKPLLVGVITLND